MRGAGMKLSKLKLILSERLCGTYRLTGRILNFDEDGSPYLRLRLSDCDGDHEVLAPLKILNMPEKLQHLDLITVYGTAHYSSAGKVMLLSRVQRATGDDLAKLPVLQTLPRVSCPRPDLLDRLTQTVRAMHSEALQVFVSRILERDERLEVFLRAPASKRYHHNEPSGLLEHSLDVAHAVVLMCRHNQPDMPRFMREAGYVAGLFHDIGKIYAFDIHGKPTATGTLYDHTDLTLEACALGLKHLDVVEPDMAQLLRHIWTCASPGSRYGMQPVTPLARYVRDADAHSAMVSNHAKVFGTRAHGFGKLGNNRYWLPRLHAAGDQQRLVVN